MGKQVLDTIVCCKCHRMFDVATENIEWEHISDAGETEDDASIHDFKVFQSVECPHCRKENRILLHAKGKAEDQLETMVIISLEKE